MRKRESILSKDLHLIRVAGEENNARTRDAWKNKYKRINREKKGKFWIWFYYWSDKIFGKKKKARQVDVQKKEKSLEDELVVMEKDKGCVANGKIRNVKK